MRQDDTNRPAVNDKRPPFEYVFLPRFVVFERNPFCTHGRDLGFEYLPVMFPDDLLAKILT